MTAPNAFPFHQWQADADPEKWALRCVSDAGVVVVPMPSDRDVERAALAASRGAAVWCHPQMASPSSREAPAERRRLGLSPRQRIEPMEFAAAQKPMSTFDTFDAEDPEDFASDMQPDATVDAARREALVSMAAARAAAARAEIAEHERRRAEADAAARQFAQGGGPGAQFEALARLLAEQQRAADARIEMMLSRMAPQRRGLEDLRETLGLFAAVRELMAEHQEPELDGTAAIVREVRQLVPDLLSAWRRPQPAPQPAPQMAPVEPPPPLPPPPLPAAHRAPTMEASAARAGNQIATKRVREFVQQIAQEVAVGADAQAVADGLADQVALLPGPIRSALDAGQWGAAWSAVQPYLDAEELQTLEPFMQSAEVAQWLGAFAEALALEDVGGDAVSITA